MLESLFTSAATWFGYVGACAVAPDATCRPFLAFLALGAAASAALTLVLIACRVAYRQWAAQANPARFRDRAADVPERSRRNLLEPRLAPHAALRSPWRVAAS